jgi:hypothetical protein
VSLLLLPEWDLGLDRWDLVERLQEFGIPPTGHYWVVGVEGLPSPGEFIWQLRRTPEGDWEVGVEERGSFQASGRFSVEAHACQWLLRTIVAHEVVSMGTNGDRPFIVPDYRDAVRASLADAVDLVEGQSQAVSNA